MTKPSDLRKHLGFWLRIVSNSVSQAFARKLQAHGFIVAEWVMLRDLYDAGPMGPTRLAEQMGMTKGAISKLADRLVEGGYVVRLADPEDKRAQNLAITPKGREIIPALAAMADENDQEFFGDLEQVEQETLERLLKKIVERRGLTAVPTD